MSSEEAIFKLHVSLIGRTRFLLQELKSLSLMNSEKMLDLVIVTAILHFEEIENFLNKRAGCSVVSLEDALKGMWGEGVQ